MRILEGRALERLHNGSSVPYDFQLQALAENKRTVLRRTASRFVFSYDLWEEKFAVTRVSEERRSASHLSAGAAETWALDHIMFRTSDLPRVATVWLKLEVRADDAERDPLATDSGISLADLIEVFSRTARPTQQKWTFESGPVRLDGKGAGPG